MTQPARVIELPHNWDPRVYQVPIWKYMAPKKKGQRAVCVWHRRCGKDLVGVNLVAYKAMQRVGTYWHMLPTYKQGRSIVWNGMTGDGVKFTDFIPNSLVASRNATEMRITMKNGSIYQVVGTDNIDSLVGTNPVGVILSEYSLHDPAAWDYVRPILAENGGWALFLYTARGKNHGYTLLKRNQKNPKWFTEVLVAGDKGTKKENGLPVVSDQDIQDERDSGMPEELIQQEFYCSFDAPMFGAYYSNQMAAADKAGRITKVLHEPKLPVDTYWDLGVGDETVIWFVQDNRGELRVIDCYAASGEGLRHYIKVLRGNWEGHEHMGDYTYRNHYAPHDIEVRDLSTGEKRKDTARKLGLKFKVVQRHGVEERIDATRNIIGRCWFDEDKCERGIEALRSYRKEWDDKRKTFRDNPLHDWASHYADSFGLLPMTVKRSGFSEPKRPRQMIDDYQYI